MLKSEVRIISYVRIQEKNYSDSNNSLHFHNKQRRRLLVIINTHGTDK